MKALRSSCVIAVISLLCAVSVHAGVLDPTDGPGGTNSSMYTIDDVYNRLNTGAAGSKQTFTEPSAVPPTGTMRTLNDIMGKAPAKDDTDGAKANHVLTGKKFWGLTTAGWGLQTGTAPVVYTCDCTGCSLSPLGRWCDNNNGTVRDMSTGLLWLKDAEWGGQYAFWSNGMSLTNAHDRAAMVKNGYPATLTDGSSAGDWRLPTKKELVGITTGTESIISSSMYKFMNVQAEWYWSSSTDAGNTGSAWYVRMGSGAVGSGDKTVGNYVWPVRGGQ